MLRFRGSSEILRAGLRFALLFLIPVVTAGEAAAQNPPVNAEASQVPDTVARAVLDAALAESGKTDRLVFLHTGADW